MSRKEILNEEYLDQRVEATGGETRKVVYRGRRGAPDRLCIWPNRAVNAWFEVKEEEQVGYGLQDHQAREHKKLRGAGMDVFVVASKADIDRALGLLGIR